MAVTPPTFDAATIALLVSGKSKIDAPVLVEQAKETWFTVQFGLRRASAAAREVIASGKPASVAADRLRDNGVVLGDKIASYTESPNKSAIDSALGTVLGLTPEEIAAAVAHLTHGCSQLAATPADGSEALALCDMIDAYYSVPKQL